MQIQLRYSSFWFSWTKVHFVGPLVPSVSDFGCLCPRVSKSEWIDHRLCSFVTGVQGSSNTIFDLFSYFNAKFICCCNSNTEDGAVWTWFANLTNSWLNCLSLQFQQNACAYYASLVFGKTRLYRSVQILRQFCVDFLFIIDLYINNQLPQLTH